MTDGGFFYSFSKLEIRPFTNFARAHGIAWSEYADQWDRVSSIFDDVARKVNDLETAAANERIAEKVRELQFEYVRMTGSIRQVREAERERAWEQITNSEKYIKATQEMRDAVKQAFEELWDQKQRGDVWRTLRDNINRFGRDMVNIIQSIAQLRANTIQNEVDEQLRALDEMHRARLEYYEKEKQARLFARGFIEAQTEEQHAKVLRLAIESGNQQRIFEAHNAYERFQIEQDFLNKKNEAQEEYNQQRTLLEYKAALAQWRMQLTNAIASSALAITMAGMNKWPFPAVPMMALATGKTIAQVGIVKQNKPKMEMYKDGGIVPGSSFRGDTNRILANSGEMMLNQRQQRNLFNQIARNSFDNNTPIEITVNLTSTLDGKVLAQNTVKHINNRQALIQARSILN